ncbi:MAG TPA: SEC-C metal-binding domain-containing protein, partial [Nitriliruptoraceae bacterium]|nr:SEC-C metal-binding domain-containing protein [Nitriliruptoraceae bacterium]
VRDDHADQIYKTEMAKFNAVVEDIAQRVERGQPVLVGTTSVEKSELLSGLLKQRGVPHNVLNAKQHAREAHIVAQAGRSSAVTVATNMAGRGTDILLGGNPEEMAKDVAARLGEEATDEERRDAYTTALAEFEAQTRAEKDEVIAAGGLYVIGTERHDSRRIDNQLRGRSGRQGDPGASRFYLSLGDDLMRLFNASAVDSIMTRLNVPDDMPIEAKMVTRAISNAQRQVESRNFDIRKNVLKYDDVLNDQRKVVYGSRQALVEGDDEAIQALADEYLDGMVIDLFDTYAPPGVFPEEWDLDTLFTRLRQVYEPTVHPDELDFESVERGVLVDEVLADVRAAYDARVDSVGGEEVMRQVERRVILNVVDRKWRQHLYEMDALRDGIGLRAVGQRDPLTEYQREAYHSFMAMMSSIKEEAVTYFFKLPVKTEQERQQEAASADEDTTDGRAAAGISLGGVTLGAVSDVDEGASTDGGSDGTSNGGAESADAAAAQDAGAASNGSGAGSGTGTTDGDGDGMTVVFDDADEPDEPTDVSYSSATTGRGSASYTLGGSAPGGAGGDVTKRDDGTTVRKVAAGTTYTTASDDYAGVGRNDPCPCGSGDKFKRCHGG